MSELKETGEARKPAGGSDERGELPHRRWWTAGGVAVAVAFAMFVVITGRNAAVPVGGSGSMPGMQMGGDANRVALTLRDIEGRRLVLPGGRAGAILFTQAGGCSECVRAGRALAAAEATVPGRQALTVIGLDATETRDEFATFDRAAGRPPVRYALDDRNGMLANMLDAGDVPTALVYDRLGRVTGRPQTRLGALTVALQRAR